MYTTKHWALCQRHPNYFGGHQNIPIDISYLDISDSLNGLQEAGAQTPNILYYLMFVIALELVLRIVYGFLVAVLTPPKRKRRQPQAIPAMTDEPQIDKKSETRLSVEPGVQTHIPQPIRAPFHHAGALPSNSINGLDPAPTASAQLRH